MNNLNNEQYLMRGIKAIGNYEADKAASAIDNVIAKTENLHFKSSGVKFKRTAIKMAELTADRKSMLANMNKNEVYKKTMENIEKFVEDNKEEIKVELKEFEDETAVKLADIGFDGAFYNRFVSALKEQGLIGTPGALNVLADTVIDKLDPIVELVGTALNDGVPLNNKKYISDFLGNGEKTGKFSNRIRGAFQNDDIKQKSLEFVAMSGITTEGIKKAYAESGFGGEKGVIKYVAGKLLKTAAPYADIMLMQLQLAGVTHNVTSKTLIDSYEKNGVLGREGLLEHITGLALEVPGIEKYLYMQMLSLALNNQNTPFKAISKSSDKYAELRAALAKEAKAKNINALVQNTPDVISADKLKHALKTGGLYGEDGLLKYLSNNSSEIYADAIKYKIISESDADSIKVMFNQLPAIKDLKQLNPMEKYAIALSKKAEQLGVDEQDILSDNKYIAERKEAIIEGFGSINAYFMRNKGYASVIDAIDTGLNLMQKKELTFETIQGEVKDSRPDEGVLQKGYDILANKYVTEDNFKRAEDYLRLAKGYLEYQIEDSKIESALYK